MRYTNPRLLYFTLLCILYDLCNCLHCCVNNSLSILFIQWCKMSLSYEESDIFFGRRGEMSGSGSRVCEILGDLTLGPSYVTEPMHMHEPWAGQ